MNAEKKLEAVATEIARAQMFIDALEVPPLDMKSIPNGKDAELMIRRKFSDRLEAILKVDE